jgi:hypothetical protein
MSASIFLILMVLIYFQKIFAQYFLSVSDEPACGLEQSLPQFTISLFQNFTQNFMKTFILD